MKFIDREVINQSLIVLEVKNMAPSRKTLDVDCCKEIIDKTSDLVNYLDSKDHLVHVNQSWKDKLGYTDREIKALTLWDIIAPQSKEHFHSIYLQAINSKAAVNVETVFISKNNSTVPVKGSIRCDVDNSGDVTGLWGVFQTTAGKQGDENLRNQAELLQTINDNIFDLVSLADPEGNFTFVSKSHQILGYHPESLIGKPVLEFVHPDDLSKIAQTLQEFISKKLNDIKAEFRYRCADGQYIWLETLGRTITDNHSNIRKLFFSSRDITERKLVEQSLREEEAFKQLLLDLAKSFINIPLEEYGTAIHKMLARVGSYLNIDRIFVFKHDYKRRTTSEIYEWCAEGIGSDKGNAQDTSFDSFTDILEDMQKGKVIQIPDTTRMTEYQLMKPYFEKHGILSLLAIPMFFENINIGFVGFSSVNRIRSYTEKETSILQVLAEIISNSLSRQQSEKQVLAQKERLANILQATSVGTWEWNVQSGETVFNERWAEMIGYTLEELAPVSIDTWSKYTHPEDLEASNKMLERHFKGELDYYDCECRMKHKNGYWIWVQDQGRVITRTADGKPLLMFGTHTDITEKKQAEHALADRNKMLSTLNMYSIQQSETRTYDELLELIAVQLGNYLDVIAYTFSEYNIARNTLTLKKIKAEQRLIDLAAQMGVGSFLDMEIPLNDEQYSEITSSIIVIKTNLAEALLHSIPERVPRTIQKVSGTKYLVGLGHIIEGHLYGISMIGLKDELNTAAVDFLKSYAYISAISLRRLQAEEEIRYISLHDSLTNLHNRYFLEKEMARLDTTAQLPLSVIMADLNGLKMINDTYGHLHGDEMLKAVATIIKSCCRKKDIIARWGGDEFVVLLPRTNAIKAETICKKINTRCNEFYIGDIPISIALGVASKASREEDLIKTLHEAEDEMYKQKLAESRSTRSTVLSALLKTLEEKSFETEKHTQRMKEIARFIGLKLNLPDAELTRLDLLITLHDIGKINISEEILTKKDRLTEEELETMRKHPEIGFRITRATEEFSHVAEDILSHHERWDGSGYPRGLKGKEIPLLARITALADAYEIMSYGRPYKKAMSHQEIVDEFASCAGQQFDPELVDLLINDILIENEKNLTS